MDEQRIEFHVNESKIRLDRYLAERVEDLSRSAAQRLIDGGQITVNGELVKASYKVRVGDVVVVAYSALRI